VDSTGHAQIANSLYNIGINSWILVD